MASSKPKWDLTDALRRARIATRLAAKHDAVVTPRLPAGLAAQLAGDRATLGDGSARSTTALTGQKTATSHERGTAADGHDLVIAIRNAVACTKDAPDTLRTALGIGDGLKATDTQK